MVELQFEEVFGVIFQIICKWEYKREGAVLNVKVSPNIFRRYNGKIHLNISRNILLTIF